MKFCVKKVFSAKYFHINETGVSSLSPEDASNHLVIDYRLLRRISYAFFFHSKGPGSHSRSK